jgi:hypothetical protein
LVIGLDFFLMNNAKMARSDTILNGQLRKIRRCCFWLCTGPSTPTNRQTGPLPYVWPVNQRQANVGIGQSLFYVQT